VALSVVCIGDNCIDAYVRPAPLLLVGGQAVNVAVGLDSAGIPVRYVGRVGTDAAGAHIRATLTDLGIDTRGLTQLPGETGVTCIALDDRGERQFLLERDGVSAPVTPSPAELEAAAAAPLVYLSRITDREAVTEWLSARGAVIALDLSDEATTAASWRGRIRFAFWSRSGLDGAAVAQEGARLRSLGVEEVVCTLGAGGATVIGPAGVHHAEAMMGPVVDTLGAGDAFAATYLAARMGERNIAESVDLGLAAAAATCRVRGAWTQQPWTAPPDWASVCTSTGVDA
jgi:sugar/nucleoside kinase (ribokinase family)